MQNDMTTETGALKVNSVNDYNGGSAVIRKKVYDCGATPHKMSNSAGTMNRDYIYNFISQEDRDLITQKAKFIEYVVTSHDYISTVWVLRARHLAVGKENQDSFSSTTLDKAGCFMGLGDDGYVSVNTIDPTNNQGFTWDTGKFYGTRYAAQAYADLYLLEIWVEY